MASSKPPSETPKPEAKPQAPTAATLQSNGKPTAPVFTDYASI